jgi:hypothetical protein
VTHVIRFLVVELIYLGLNLRFDMCYIFLLIILSVGGVVPINSETFLMTNLINLKIKPAQSFKFTHRNRIYVYVFIRVSAHIYIYIYINICVYTVLTKELWENIIIAYHTRWLIGCVPVHAREENW